MERIENRTNRLTATEIERTNLDYCDRFNRRLETAGCSGVNQAWLDEQERLMDVYSRYRRWRDKQVDRIENSGAKQRVLDWMRKETDDAMLDLGRIRQLTPEESPLHNLIRSAPTTGEDYHGWVEDELVPATGPSTTMVRFKFSVPGREEETTHEFKIKSDATVVWNGEVVGILEVMEGHVPGGRIEVIPNYRRRINE